MECIFSCSLGFGVGYGCKVGYYSKDCGLEQIVYKKPSKKCKTCTNIHIFKPEYIKVNEDELYKK